jgi:hypothetical protein
VDAVFDGIGGENLWRSREALRPGGIVWFMVLRRSYVAGDWLLDGPAVAIAFVNPPFSGGTSLATGFSPGGNGCFPIASSGSNG